MDEALRKSGDWPNIALKPGTLEHAATGEHVEQPENTRIGRSRGACRPISAPGDSEPADVENGAQNGLECDTREKLEADARDLQSRIWDAGCRHDGISLSHIMNLLDRQDAITRAEWCNEQGWWDSAEECNRATAKVHDLQDQVDSLEEEAESHKRTANRLHNEVEYLEGQLAELTAERDELREKNRRQRKQLFELQNAIHERNEGTLKRQWKQQVEELKAEAMRNRDGVERLTAERDDLRSRLKTQADSFAKLERDNAQLRDKLERVRELAGGDTQ